jgi:tRNA dimethylallyltransferase
MNGTPQLLPLLVIAGPTGSGKSELALEVAEAIGGEIVSADAFAVYRGLDIGTDKPGAEARRRVRHHLIDIADPRQPFSAGHFVAAAAAAIDDIRARGSVPVVAGGTHFYIRALLLGLFESPPSDAALRARLAAEWDADPARTVDRLRAVDPTAADRIAAGDRHRVQRALEVWELTGVPISEHWRRHQSRARYRALLAAPHRERRDLYARIDLRVDDMFSFGLEEEVTQILASGVPAGAHALKAIGYAQVVRALARQGDRSTAIEQTKQASRRLAKRQLTWLRSLREGVLEWVPSAEQGGAAVVVAKWMGSTVEGSEA